MMQARSRSIGSARGARGKYARGLLRALALLATIIIIYYLGSIFYFRLDLTADKRYTLTRTTGELLEGLEGPLYVQSYLGGELPVEFARLRQGLDELLQEYRVKSGYRVIFEHSDPNGESNADKRRALQQQLVERGISPVSVREQGSGGRLSETLVFPGVTLSYEGRTESISLFTNSPTRTNAQNINAAIENLEYLLSSAMARLQTGDKPPIAFLTGHGELPSLEVASWAESLSRSFSVTRCPFPANVGDLDKYKFVIVAGPRTPFSEREKLTLDQYIMQGGQLFLLLSPTTVNQDSLQAGGVSLAYANEVNLGDLLFRYGVRLDPVIVQDLQCAIVPVNTALAGQPARFSPMPWLYYPLLTPNADDPISRNINPVYSRYPGAIDFTGGSQSLERRVVLHSSRNARPLTTPRLVSMQEIENDPRRESLFAGPIPVGAILSGSFTSAFRHRPLGAISGGQRFDLIGQSERTKIAVLADASIAQNATTRRGNALYPLPLGFDKYTQETFGNRDLLDNIALYLNGQEHLLALRSRQLAVRVLDPREVEEHRVFWQVFNLTVPSLLLLLIGLGLGLWRRRKYRR